VVVLFHQIPSSSLMYVPLMSRLLDRGLSSIAPDFPGFGDSPRWASQPSLLMIAEAVFELLDFLDAERVTLFGHHSGASMAVQMAALNPDRVDAIILSGTPLLSSGQQERLVQGLLELETLENEPKRSLIQSRIAAKAAGVSERVIDREVDMALDAGSEYLKGYQMVFDHPLASQLEALDLPGTTIMGEYDSLNFVQRGVEALLPEWAHHGVPGAGTYLCETHAGVLADILQRSAFPVDEKARTRRGSGRS
jgi:pimeloyl-ACP methyl ester carboxylesterase